MRKNFCVRDLDEILINRFKEYVRRKYGGKLHGVLRVEIENALRTYLEGRDNDIAHTHTHKPEPHKSETKEVVQESRANNNLIYASYDETEANEKKSEVKPDNPNEPSIPPSERTKRRIIWHLKSKGMLDVERINENAVKRVIGIEAGYDPRTINKYFNILEDDLLLPHIEYVNIRDSRKLR